MDSPAAAAPDVHFEFGCYKFNGKGVRPVPVSSVADAHFTRSWQSVEAPLIEIARQRVNRWSHERGISITMVQPFPSSTPGKFWLEFHFGGYRALSSTFQFR
jgi:hypothetical protein